MTDPIEAALRQERIEIARMIEHEARQHEGAATELRDAYEHAEIAEEAWQHDSDAQTLRSIADKIRARTPPAAPEPPEPKF